MNREDKKFRGVIRNWRYSEYLDGKIIVGTLNAGGDEDRYRQGFRPNYEGIVYTSIVLDEYEKDGKTYIETNNSIYELVGDERE